MTPANELIYKTLSLLTMLSRSRQQFLPKLSEEEKSTITISKQVLNDAGLTVPQLSNSLQKLNDKGYLQAVTIFDDSLRTEINNTLNSDDYNVALQELKKLETVEFSEKLKLSLREDLKKLVPQGMDMREEKFDMEDITLSNIIERGTQELQKLRPDDMAIVVLMPFRNIEVLHTKIGDGEKFEDIQDSGIWYDPTKFEFHLDGEIIPTHYQGKPNIEHDALLRLVDDFEDGVIYYDDIENRTDRSLKDSLLKFVDKNEKLKDIFIVHYDHLEFSKEAFR